MLTYANVRDWRGEKTKKRKGGPFKVSLFKATEELKDTLRRMQATDIVLRGFWRVGDLGKQGQVYADARPTEPGIQLEYRRAGILYRVECDRFLDWGDNVRALGLTLEGLRTVERYGVVTGEQFEGFRALPPAGGSTVVREMTYEEAIEWLATMTNLTAHLLEQDADIRKLAVRRARSRAHPDNGGSGEQTFQLEAVLTIIRTRILDI